MTCAKELILNAHRHGHEYDETRTITFAVTLATPSGGDQRPRPRF